MPVFCRSLILSALAGLCAGLSFSQPVPEAQSPRRNPAFVTHHQERFNGVQVDYTAMVAQTTLKNDKGEAAGALYSIAYTKDGVSDVSRRPVAFIFNGGPGAASTLLHMAAFGPRRGAVAENGKPPGAPPYSIVENEYSLLDASDLVFIDRLAPDSAACFPRQTRGFLRDDRGWAIHRRLHSALVRRQSSLEFSKVRDR